MVILDFKVCHIELKHPVLLLYQLSRSNNTTHHDFHLGRFFAVLGPTHYRIMYVRGFQIDDTWDQIFREIWTKSYRVFFKFYESPKGQLISKYLFGFFNFSQKTNENKSTWGIIVSSKVEFFRLFFGRIEDTKKLKLTDF